MWSARYLAFGRVLALVTAAATQAWHALVLCAAQYQLMMPMAIVALARELAVSVTVETAGVPQHRRDLLPMRACGVGLWIALLRRLREATAERQSGNRERK